MHLSELAHLGLFAGYLALLEVLARSARPGRRMRSIAGIIQLAVALLCVDLLLGFTLVDRWYGSSVSASWMSRAIYLFPVLLVAGVWRALRHARLRRRG